MHISIFILFLLSICYGKNFGGQTDEDPKDPKYQKMAEEVVRNHIKIKEAETKNVIVYKVTTQEVAGRLTRIKFRVFLVNGKSSMCNSEIWEKPWENVKQISYDCNSILNNQKLISTVKSRPKLLRDPNNDKYKILAKQALGLYFKTPGKKLFRKGDINSLSVKQAVVTIQSEITVSVVFVITTHNNGQFECKATILETPWAIDNEAKVPHINCHISQRDTNSFGGSQNINDPKYKQLAEKSFKRYLEMHTSVKIRVKDLKVDKVIVAGKTTRIDFHVNPTNGGHTITCHSDVIIRNSFFNQLEFHVKCNLNDKKIGGQEEQDPNKQKYKKMAKEAFDKYRETYLGPLFTVTKFQVTKVSTQLVAGEITTLDFNVFTDSDYRYKCHSEILEQKWLQIKNITVMCDPLTSLKLSAPIKGPQINDDVNDSNRGKIGGDTEQDPKDPKYKQLAEESFKKYKDKYIRYLFSVKELKIIKVTTQLVSGVITRIDFQAIPTKGASLQCHSEILEQPWLQNKVIKVNCVSPVKLTLALSGGNQKLGKSLIETAITDYFENRDTTKRVRVEKSQIRGSNIIRTRVGKEDVQYYKVDVFASTLYGDYSFFNCSVVFATKNHQLSQFPIDVNCKKVTRLLGSAEWVDPSNEKFISYADMALQEYARSSKKINIRENNDVIVTFVLEGLTAGYHYEMDFIVRPAEVDEPDRKCHAAILKDLEGILSVKNVDCGDNIEKYTPSWDYN